MNTRKSFQLCATVGLATLLLAVLLWASVGSSSTVASAPASRGITALNNGSVITIGVAAARSDSVPGLGWRQTNAVQLAVDQINAAGGVDIGGITYTLSLVMADSMCDGTQAITAANELLDAGALAVVGHTCSSASTPAQAVYNAAGVAMVSPSSTGPAVTEQGYSTTFRVIGRDDTAAVLLATHFKQELGLNRAAIVEWSGSWGSFALGAFDSTFTDLGGTVTSWRVVSSTADYTATLTAIKAEGPDVIYYADDNSDNAGQLSRIAHDLGMDDVIVAWDSLEGGDLETYVNAAGAAAQGDYGTVYWPATGDMPGYAPFNADYQAAEFPNYGDEAEMWGAFAYDAAQIIISAIDRADSADPAAIRDEIAATADYYGVVGKYGGFDAQGDVDPQWAWLERYQDGQWTRVSTQGTGELYVNGATGGDTANDCRNPAAPCQSVARAVAWADPGDTVLVAGGTYSEHLSVSKPLTLAGGYEAVGWTRDLAQNETMLDGSGGQTVLGDWDGEGVKKVAVISDAAASEYKMWFDGTNLRGMSQVGLATSSDGVLWIKHLANPVLTTTVDDWEGWGEEHAPFVMLESDVYKMWYEDSDNSVRQLGYATSTNGIDWTKYAGNPVLAAGPETFDQQAAAHGSVLVEGGTLETYKLWYHAIGDQGTIVAYATSMDGVTWNKQGPVLTGLGGEWDESVWGSSVLKFNGDYWMWYAAAGPESMPSIGVVTSTDGIAWTRFLTGPVIATDGPLGDPHVISDSGVLKMWYQDFEQGVINYAESDDGVSWTTSLNNPVLIHGETGHWGGPVVRFQDGSAGAVLDGFTISGGDGQLGGGVHVENNAGATIRNCLIRDNVADGVPIAGAGAGVGSGGDYVTIIDSRIVNNQVVQGAGGVRAYGGSTLVMVNTVVANNHGDVGIHTNDPTTLINVTLADNDGGIFFFPPESTTLFITNSIVYSNGYNSLDVSGAGIAQVVYSDIEGGWPGVGNIDADPQFADSANGDYHLQQSSPCIDAGTSIGAPDADFEGDLRPIGGGFDMGADEAPLSTTADPGAPATLTYTDTQGSPTTLDIPAGAVSETTTIVYTPKDPKAIQAAPSGLSFGGHAFELEAYYQDGAPLSDFEALVTLIIHYSDADVADLFEDMLAPHRWTGDEWQEIGAQLPETYTLDVENNLLTLYLMRFSRFGSMGLSINQRLYLPLVVKSN